MENRKTFNITTTTMVLILYLTTGINCCAVTPREILATVGEVVSLGCNARPNNEQQGTVSNLKLENEDRALTLIVQAPVYNRNGDTVTKQFVAEGYFLSELDENHVNATIQINETRLKHGGRYECSCTAEKTSTGSGNLVVLADKLSFVLNGGNPQTPEALLDLNCSLSFGGSISSVSVDLAINDANGTELAAKRNLSLSRSQGGSHHVNYSFIAHPNFKEQNFSCQMKAWNQSSSKLLRSMTANYSLNSGYMTTSLPYSWPRVTPATEYQTLAGVAVGVVLVLIVFYFIHRKRSRNSSMTIQHIRSGDGKSPIEHPTEDKEQKNKTGVDNEVFVIDNDIYEASPRRNEPTDDHKAEQSYNAIC